MGAVSDRVRRTLLRKSAGNRMFFDALIRLIWCECKAGATKSKSSDEWCDIMLPHYGSGNGARVDNEIPMAFNTPRRILSKSEIDAVQSFIDTHTFADVTDAKKQIADDLLNHCCATALNVIV